MNKLAIGLPFAVLILLGGCGDRSGSSMSTEDAVRDSVDAVRTDVVEEVVEEVEDVDASGGDMLDAAMQEGETVLDDAMKAGQDLSQEQLNDLANKASEEAEGLEEDLKGKLNLGN